MKKFLSLLTLFFAAAFVLTACCDIEGQIRISRSGNCEGSTDGDGYICPGDGITLCWASKNATSASIDGIGTVNLSDFMLVTPAATQDYVLKLSNSSCSTERRVTVNVVTEGSQVDIIAPPYPPHEDWEANIPKDHVSELILLTSLETKCASGCFRHQAQLTPGNPNSLGPDPNAPYEKCSMGGECNNWWAGTKTNPDGSFVSIDIRGNKIPLPYVPYVGLWVLHESYTNSFHSNWGSAMLQATGVCKK